MPVHSAPRTFCDVSTFYHPMAGGVRSYYHAKLRWFARQDRLKYVLIYPGTGFHVRRLGPQVTCVTVYGWPVGDPARSGYRMMADLRRLRDLIYDCDPDVLETGDAWISGPLGLALRYRGHLRGLVSSFYHSDPEPTYFSTWFRRPWLGPVGTKMADVAGGSLARMQSLYDVTMVSSRLMESRLRARSISRIGLAPFGVDPRFLSAGAARGGKARGPRTRLLYAGRLDPDKGLDVLLAALPALLARGDVDVTVMGRGRYVDRIAAIVHPRFQYLGFVARTADVARIYAAHDVLLAPGPHETFGLAALEGMAAGLVVIGPDQGGTAELLEDAPLPCRFIAGSPESLLAAVNAVLASDLAVGSQAARATASHYGTWDDAIAREVSLYGGWSRRS